MSTENEYTPEAPTARQAVAFDVTPFKADGGFRMGDAMQMIGALGIVGILLGIITHYVSKLFYFILLFPLGIGVLVGLWGNWCITRFKIRSPLIGGVSGLVAGCLAMTAMHYWDYREFESNFTDNPQLAAVREMVQQAAQADPVLKENSPEFREFANQFDPEILQALLVDSFPSYVDMAAKRGVEINSNRGGGKGSNLGYTGTYIYWGVEMLIVAGIAFAMMSSTAGQPFCVDCNLWKTPEVYGPIKDPAHVTEMIQAGRIEPVESGDLSVAPGAFVTLSVCGECLPEEIAPDPRVVGPGAEPISFEIFVERGALNGKGELTKSMLSRTTYPITALPVIREALQAIHSVSPS
ncbi:MAG: hypothetical protein R3C01_14720 [Planctomycetaceae bacterium]